MLYIFRVDTGSMLTLDMGLALENVHHLKQAVQTNCGIPQEKQVLLISGQLSQSKSKSKSESKVQMDLE